MTMAATHLKVDTDGDVYVIHVQNSIVTTTETFEFAAELSRIDDGSRKIVLDFSKVQWISAATIGTLISAAKKRKGRAPQLRLSNLGDVLRDIFNILNLAKVFTICTDEREAVESLQGQARTVCQDCKGTGEYIGLNVREPCQTCDGHGSVPSSSLVSNFT
jgi:anti-anti-sigma factor